MLHVSLLGEQAIVDAAGSARTRSSKTVALVGLLASHAGADQPRQHIAGLFWPGSSDAQARTNLRRELHHLRQVLGGDDSLTVTSTALSWHDTDTCEVDLRVFLRERAAAVAARRDGDDARAVTHGRLALERYRGSFLPASYDDWVETVRADLERMCVDLCDLVTAACRRTRDLAWGIDAARRRVALQPLEEAGYRTLMELQSLAGERAGAISTYHHCASLLERELGIEPDEVTRRCFATLVDTAAPGRPHTRRRSMDVRVVGRDAELAGLQELWHGDRHGSPLAVLVSGDPGVGKTRLLEELAATARTEGAVVATAQCFGVPGRVPLTPVAEWLGSPDIHAAARALEPVWRTELERLLPAESSAGGHPATAADPMVDAWQRHRFLEGLRRALLSPRRATLLVLDNVQWCDDETLDLVTLLLNRPCEHPLTVALTSRAVEEAGGPPLPWVRRLRDSGRLVEIGLSPLDSVATGELAALASGRELTEDERTLLHAATGGYPLYVVEAMRGDVVDLTHAAHLGTVLHHRLDQTSPEAREVAGLAAAVGRDFALDLLVEASDLHPDAVVAAVDELWRHRLLREFKDGYDFSHDLIRDAAYAQVGPARRWLLSRRLAQGLELTHSGCTEVVAAQLAEQYERARNPERALVHLEQAAVHAGALFAHAEAVQYRRRMLSMLERLPRGRERDTRELDCLHALGPPLTARAGYAAPELQRTLERAVALSERLGRRTEMVISLVGLWASRFVQGRTRDAHAIATRSLGLAGDDSRLACQAHFSFAGSALHLGMPDLAVRHFEAAGGPGGSASLFVGTRLEVHALAWSAHALWAAGRPEEAAHAATTSVAMARGADHAYSLAVALAYAGITHQLLGDRRRVLASSEELLRICSRCHFVYYNEWGLVLQGWCVGGEAGVRLVHRGLRQLRASGSFARMPYWLMLLADTSRGDPDASRAVLDAALVAAETNDDQWVLPELMRRRSHFDTDTGTAVDRLHAAIRLAGTQGSVMQQLHCERDLAASGVRAAAGISPEPLRQPNAPRTPRA